MLSIDIIGAMRTLLARVDLKGAEVPAFNKIMMALAAEENEVVTRARMASEARVGPMLTAVPDAPPAETQAG